MIEVEFEDVKRPVRSAKLRTGHPSGFTLRAYRSEGGGIQLSGSTHMASMGSTISPTDARKFGEALISLADRQ